MIPFQYRAPDYHDRAIGIADDLCGRALSQSVTEPAEPRVAYYHQPYVLVTTKFDNLVARKFARYAKGVLDHPAPSLDIAYLLFHSLSEPCLASAGALPVRAPGYVCPHVYQAHRPPVLAETSAATLNSGPISVEASVARSIFLAAVLMYASLSSPRRWSYRRP